MLGSFRGVQGLPGAAASPRATPRSPAKPEHLHEAQWDPHGFVLKMFQCCDQNLCIVSPACHLHRKGGGDFKLSIPMVYCRLIRLKYDLMSGNNEFPGESDLSHMQSASFEFSSSRVQVNSTIEPGTHGSARRTMWSLNYYPVGKLPVHGDTAQ